MIAAGFMAKVVALKPQWIKSASAVRTCSVSNVDVAVIQSLLRKG